MFAAFALPALAATAVSPVKSYVAGSLDVQQVRKTMSVYAEYVGEDDITSAMRQRIAELGYPLAESADKADLLFKVTTVYFGKASDRPKTGTYDGVSNSQGISLGKLLLWATVGIATDIKPVAGGSSFHAASVADYWTSALRDSGVISEVEHAFKMTRKAQDAIVTRIELTANGVTQTADVVTESFAEDVPGTMLTGENLRQAVWYLE